MKAYSRSWLEEMDTPVLNISPAAEAERKREDEQVGERESETDARRGFPAGSRCEVCGLFGPRSHMGWSSVRFEPTDEFHQRLVRGLPAPFKLALHPGARVGFWAHVNGHGCDAETET